MTKSIFVHLALLTLILSELFAASGSKSRVAQPDGIFLQKNNFCSRGLGRNETAPSNIPLSPRTRPPLSDAEFRLNKPATDYPMSELNQLSYDDLIALLVTIKWYDIPDLFQFNEDAYEFYNDNARVEALINALEQYGNSYTVESGWEAVDILVEVIRAGFYLGFYYEELAHINTWEYKSKCWPALNAIADNPNFGLGTDNQDKVFSALGGLIGSGTAPVEVLARIAPIFKDFNDNAEEYMQSYWKTASVWRVGAGIDYALVSFYLYNNPGPELSPFYQKIDPLFEEIGRLALYGTLDDAYTWLINNGVWWTGRLGQFVQDPRPNEILTQVIEVYGKWPPPSVQAAQLIDEYYDGVDANGVAIDLEQVKEELFAQLLPNTYRFDDGAVVFKTGNLVEPEKIKKLYWAMKEVKAQFHRVVGSDVPLEPGQPDDSLTAIIYNSPAEYDYNRFLYNLGTNNGGIYIESWGAFFTYERTPQESIYTLEDLFRHEYVHYLQGRFLEPGLWGRHPIYDNERLSWFDEGQAEFIAGSSRSESIRTRRTMVENIAANPSDRMALADVFGATYSTGWEFYTYGFVVHNFLYENRRDLFHEMVKHITAGDGRSFDALIDSLENDQGLNDDYTSFMQRLVDEVSNFVNPNTSDDYLSAISPKSKANIFADILTISGLTDTTSLLRSSPGHSIYQLRGTYTGAPPLSRESDWQIMDETANAFLSELDNLSWEGYRTTTCYFTNYRTNSQSEFQFDVVIQGILSSDLTTSVTTLAGEGAGTFTLQQNYPNPFNPTTTIRYFLPESGEVKLLVYNILGRRVRSLIHENQTAGEKRISWDGRNDAGELVAGGLYLFRLEAVSQTSQHVAVIGGLLLK